MLKLEHIGIAVKNLENSKELFTKLFGYSSYKDEEVKSENVKTSFFKIGHTKFELLEATDQESSINKFISKRGEGIHHIAYEVDDIEKEMERLRGEGFTLLTDLAHKGADNKLICFLHPKTTNGVLIEICQEIR